MGRVEIHLLKEIILIRSAVKNIYVLRQKPNNNNKAQNQIYVIWNRKGFS